ncbi:MAG: amidohydrolase family protein, partial [Acidilobus sp.]|nr:amidohydrolase family protein [Acidilobus sp.]
GRAGVIDKGYLADLVVVDGNPLDDVKVLRDQSKVVLVLREGAVLKDLLGVKGG